VSVHVELQDMLPVAQLVRPPPLRHVDAVRTQIVQQGLDVLISTHAPPPPPHFSARAVGTGEDPGRQRGGMDT
jgi:hypothetical protein